MTKKHRNPTTFTTSSDGTRLAHVALACGQRAILYAEDLERLQVDGWSTHWVLTSTGARHKYVLAQAGRPDRSRRSVTVARLVAQAGKGQRISYADGDRLNLRRENLVIHKGPAKAPAASLLPSRRRQRPSVCDGPEMSTANFRGGIKASGNAALPPYPGRRAPAKAEVQA